MGKLYYGGSGEAFDIPDRLLAHAKIVVSTKLRRSESFTMSWVHGADAPSGRTTIWLQPSIPLRFVFDRADADALDSEVLKRLSHAANSSAGLVLDFATFPEDHEGSAPAAKRGPVAVSSVAA